MRFPDGADPRSVTAERPDQLALPPADREAIRWGNAARLFGIGPPRAMVAPA
ncbi:MAG TPA: hypothetical protein VMC04_14995 [Verrucomicrobiae bacterium]|nr:hypothetical protein [Verrucomicrobiae bacterium]